MGGKPRAERGMLIAPPLRWRGTAKGLLTGKGLLVLSAALLLPLLMTLGSVAPDASAAATSGPLHTSGRWIVNANGERGKLASVNWDGAESPEYVVAGLDRAKLGDIAHWIKANGFNSVRLPWSNEVYEHNPKVKDENLAANPELQGKRALEILDEVVDALGHEGLMVVLDNHVSRADWCCTEYDGNGLWYTDEYPDDKWLEDWQGIVARYKNKPHEVGAELRNEVRPANGVPPTWGSWAAAAERAGDAVLSVNPDLLIIVGGLGYQADLRGVAERRVELKVGNRLVYAPHAYKGLYDVKHGYEKFKKQLGKQWGYILEQGKPYTAPLWVSEFGTCITWLANQCNEDDVNFSNGIQRYLREGDIDWAYWQLNGTQSDSLLHPGHSKLRHHGALDWYGLLNRRWNGPADAKNVERIKALQKMTQHP